MRFLQACEGLCEASALAETDYPIGQVYYSQGAGLRFAQAEILRNSVCPRRSTGSSDSQNLFAGAPIDRISKRTTAQLHGACIGAGIEMTAFAGPDGRDEPTLRFPK